MSRRQSSRSSAWTPSWRVCVCLLLIALVVYNPFVALSGSSGKLCYENLARNRASVGASELQHFSPVSAPDFQMQWDIQLPGAEPQRCAQETRAPQNGYEVAPPEPELLAAVWFRPPPSL